MSYSCASPTPVLAHSFPFSTPKLVLLLNLSYSNCPSPVLVLLLSFAYPVLCLLLSFAYSCHCLTHVLVLHLFLSYSCSSPTPVLVLLLSLSYSCHCLTSFLVLLLFLSYSCPTPVLILQHINQFSQVCPSPSPSPVISSPKSELTLTYNFSYLIVSYMNYL